MFDILKEDKDIEIKDPQELTLSQFVSNDKSFLNNKIKINRKIFPLLDTEAKK